VEKGDSSSNPSVSDRIQQMRSKMKELTDKRNNHQLIPERTQTTQSAPKTAPEIHAGKQEDARIRSVKVNG
jgi:hypothetical protein